MPLPEGHGAPSPAPRLPPGIAVDVARPDDAGELTLLLASIHAEERWMVAEIDEFDADPAHMRALLSRLRSAANATVLVARGSEGIAGVVFLRGCTLRRLRHVARVELYVRLERRGQGIGSSLLASGVAWAERCRALEKLSLAVFTENETAVRLYRSHGFEIEGHRRREYRLENGRYLDDFLMFRLV
jgi:ribosomal protein S18 acetylase RimI-like enzyme